MTTLPTDIPVRIRTAVSRLNDLVAESRFDPKQRDEFDLLAQGALHGDSASLRCIRAVINLPEGFTAGAFIREVLRAMAKPRDK